MAASERGLSRRPALPRRRDRRAAARAARPRTPPRLDPSRALDRDRVSELCGRDVRSRGRPRGCGCRPHRGGREPDRRLPYGGGQTDRRDRSRAGRRPLPGLARRPRARADRGPRAGPGSGRAHPGGRPADVHLRGDRVPRRRRILDLRAAVQPRPDPRGLDLHAPRHGPPRARNRPPLPAGAGVAAAPAPRRERRGRLREGPAARVADHRRQCGHRALADRHAGLGRGPGRLRAPVRVVGGRGGADPLSRPLARRDPSDHLRPGRRSALGPVGGAALPRHPPDRGPCRRAEGDGHRAPPTPAAGDLRPPGRRADLRAPGRLPRAADARGPARDLGVLRRACSARAVAGWRCGSGRGRARRARGAGAEVPVGDKLEP